MRVRENRVALIFLTILSIAILVPSIGVLSTIHNPPYGGLSENCNIIIKITINDLDPKYGPPIISVNNNWSEIAATYSWCDGSGTFADPYVIQDLNLQDNTTDYAILIRNSNSYFHLENVTVRRVIYPNDTFYGAFLDNVMNGEIRNCTFQQLRYSMVLQNVDNITVGASAFEGCLLGVKVENGTHTHIANNSFNTVNWQSVEFYNANWSQVVNNTFSPQAYLGFYAELSHNITIQDNECLNMQWDGMELKLCEGVAIFRNTCNDNAGDGISLKDCSFCNLTGNACINNTNGILTREYQCFYRNMASFLDNNTCNQNRARGILLIDAYLCLVTNNNCTTNALSGIHIDTSAACYATANVLVDNGMAGFNLSYTSNCYVFLNVIQNSPIGSHLLEPRSGNVVTGNTFENVTESSKETSTPRMAWYHYVAIIGVALGAILFFVSGIPLWRLHRIPPAEIELRRRYERRLGSLTDDDFHSLKTKIRVWPRGQEKSLLWYNATIGNSSPSPY